MKRKANSQFEFLFNKTIVNSKRSQISFEYLIVMGFVTFVIIGVLAVALFYSGSIRDRIKITQMTNCANKIISTAESVFYAGSPSRATINCYLPEGILDIEIDAVTNKNLIFTLQTSTGRSITSFLSNVEIIEDGEKPLVIGPGSKKFRLDALEDKVRIGQV